MSRSAPPLLDCTCANTGCSKTFVAARDWQRFCSDKCRNAFHAKGDGGLRGRVKSVRVMAKGYVSVIIRFPPDARGASVELEPGRIVEVIS